MSLSDDIKKSTEKYAYTQRYINIFFCAAVLCVLCVYLFDFFYYPIRIYIDNRQTHITRIAHAKKLEGMSEIFNYPFLHLVEFPDAKKEIIAFPEPIEYQENLDAYWSPEYKAGIIKTQNPPTLYDFFGRFDGVKMLLLLSCFSAALIYGISWNLRMLIKEKHNALSK